MKGFSPGHWWWQIRRAYKRGIGASHAYYVTRPRIWQWRNPLAGRVVETVPVHVLCGAEQLDLAAWMMASWTFQTHRNWAWSIHDDGTLPAHTAARLESVGLRASIITVAAADARLEPVLAPHAACAAYRREHPLARKIFDVPVLAGAPRFLLLDTDVLFFAQPVEILQWVDNAADTSCWFNEDCTEASTVTSEEAVQQLGVALWPRVNSGLCLLPTAAIDLEFCERVLRETAIKRGHIWRVEQTLFALCASRHGRGGLLPTSYEVSLGLRRSPGAIARHYVGAVRNRFWGEGVRALAPLLHR